jgi:hypothetical protein
MTRWSVVYVGCGLSGRRTSLAEVLRCGGKPSSPLTLSGAASYDIELCVDGTRTELSMSISAARSHLYYDDPTSTTLSELVRSELALLEAADGIVFVLDGQIARMPANFEQFEMLHRDLRSRGVDASGKPTVFQVNKQDLANGVRLEQVRRDFFATRADYVESVATRGVGPVDAVMRLVRLMRC